jgi:regulator of nucleoside diphosphate kinase
LIDSEARQLEEIALRIEDRSPQVSELLLRETSRAKLHNEAKIPPDVITMGSSVEFIDEGSGAGRILQLVYPINADVEAGRISVLTPIGAGLIGLREGDSILWPDRSGHERRLVILKVKQTAVQ